MTAVTVWGVATAPNQTAAHYNRWDELTDAHSYRSFNPELPADGVIVDCDHDGVPVGTLVYAEVAPDERVHCVAVIPEGERLLELDEPIYYSALLDMRGCRGDSVYVADEGRIIGLSLTLTPAALGAQPLGIHRGDLRDHGDRFSKWPSSWRTEAPILERAVAQLPRLEYRRHCAAHIVDRRLQSVEQYAGTHTPGRLEYRSATQVAVTHGRTIELIVMPYERPATIHEPGRTYEEIVSRGAFDDVEGRTNIRVNRDHDLQRTVGRAVSFDAHDPRGLVAELRISRTPLGDETVALAEDNCLDASAGFRVVNEKWDTRDRRRLTKLWLHHIALTPEPAYATANVLAVRSTR